MLENEGSEKDFSGNRCDFHLCQSACIGKAGSDWGTSVDTARIRASYPVYQCHVRGTGSVGDSYVWNQLVVILGDEKQEEIFGNSTMSGDWSEFSLLANQLWNRFSKVGVDSLERKRACGLILACFFDYFHNSFSRQICKFFCR